MECVQELATRIQEYEQWIHNLDVRFGNANLIKNDIYKWLQQLDKGEILWKQKIKEWKEKELQKSIKKTEKQNTSSTNLDKILQMARKIRSQDSPEPTTISTTVEQQSDSNTSTIPSFINEKSQKEIFLESLVGLQQKQDEYFTCEKELHEICSNFLKEFDSKNQFHLHYDSVLLFSILQCITSLQQIVQQENLSYNTYLKVVKEFETISSHLLFMEDASEKYEQRFLQQINVTSISSSKSLPQYSPKEPWITHKKIIPQLKEEMKDWFNPKGSLTKGKRVVYYANFEELKEDYCLKFEIQSNLLKEYVEKQIIENVLPKLQEMKKDEKEYLILWKLLHSSLLREGKTVCSFLNKKLN